VERGLPRADVRRRGSERGRGIDRGSRAGPAKSRRLSTCSSALDVSTETPPTSPTTRWPQSTQTDPIAQILARPDSNVTRRLIRRRRQTIDRPRRP
jgi:hypothetical protein